jgi:HSP20 family protein
MATTPTIRLEIPGMNADDFEIQVRGRSLTVAGEKRVEREENQGRYHIMERAYGRFERSVPLPSEVDEGGAQANYKNGVLTVTLPKTKETLERRIRVTNG